MPIENSMSRIAEQARGRYEDIITGAQERAKRAAAGVGRGKKPVQALSRLGLKLTAVSHRTADKIIKQNTKMIEHQLDAVASRLKAAAAAKDVRDLISTQFRLIPENASRWAEDARGTVSIVTGAGSEVADVFKGTYDELKGAPARKRASKKATKKTAKRANTKSQPAQAERHAA